MSELGKRIAVAAVGIPAVLAVAYFGGLFLAVPLALFAAWGTHEVARLAREADVRPLEWIAAPAAAGLVLTASWRPTFAAFAPPALGLVGLSALVALVAGLWSRGPEGSPLASTAVTVLSLLYVGLALAFAPLLRALPEEAGWSVDGGAGAGLAALALPLAVTWVGDASAYFAGSAWGKAKLAPSISPNKSWVGFWAAVIGGALAASVWLLVVESAVGVRPVRMGSGADPVPVTLLAVALVGGLIAVAAVVGDLVESLLKREAGVKDSGTFFPGHGGVLDRIDSLLFTIPAAYVALVLLGTPS